MITSEVVNQAMEYILEYLEEDLRLESFSHGL